MDATITDANVLEVTGRDGVKKSLELASQADAATIKTELAKKFDKESVVQKSGEAEDKVMSQKATTTAISDETTRAKAAEEAIIYDVSAHNSGVVFESLSALLSSSNLSTLIPTSVRHGGMSIKFIQGSVSSSDNKYVQARCMAQNFTTDVTKWQGVDEEPTAGSDNLVKSGGVNAELNKKLSYKTDSSPADLNIGDPNGNVIAQFKDGHIKTKNFDSRNSMTKEEVSQKADVKIDNSSADLNIGDTEGNIIAQFKEGHIKTKNFDSRDFKNFGMTETSYEGAKLSIKKNRLYYKILDGMPSSYNGSAQAAGMFNNYIVRLYDGGWCTICKLNEDDSVTLLQKFALKTQGFTKNHAGAGGFDFVKHDGDDFPYMVYGNSTLPIWYVENIHLNGTSELLQTINVTNVGPEGRWYNVHPTEDGYYLFFNIDKATGKNVFIAKMRKPSLSEGSEVTLTENDVVDSFTIHLDKFIEMQDGCVYDGKLWFAFSSGNGGDIKIFDLNSHKMTHTIPINMIPNELEDLCIYNDFLFVFYNGTSKYLKIKFD